MSTQTKQELLRFLLTGITAVTTDLCSYYLLMSIIDIDVAKAISFILGSVIAFFMNKMWTFESNYKVSSTLIQFSLLYSATFLANIAVNHLLNQWNSEIMIIAFLFATATSTVLNFIGMKFWVFRSPSITI